MKARLGIKLLSAVAVIGLTAGTAHAAPQKKETPAKETVEERLDRLEAENAAMRNEINTLKGQQTQTAATAEAAQTQAEAADAKVTQLAAAPVVAPVAPTIPDGFTVGGGKTRIKMGGFVKITAASSRFSDGEVATNSLGRDFYLPQTLPTGGGAPSRVTDFSAKQTRLWIGADSDVAGHKVGGMLEIDFINTLGTTSGSQRTTNRFVPTLRRAYLTVDKFTIGQDWTTFQYLGALPESTDFVGGAEGTPFVRQPLVRYSMPVGKGSTLHLAVENPESGTANVGAPALTENGDDAMPDFIARFAYAAPFGELSIAGLARQVRVSNAGTSDSAFGWAVSGGGKIYLNGAKSGDVRVLLTYGHNAGRYIGFNFAPDAVYDPVANHLNSANNFAALGAVRIPLGTGLRANFMGSYQSVDYDSALTPASLANFNDHSWSAAANLFYTPVKGVDVGVEYRHGERVLVSGNKGSLGRIELAAKYSF